MPSSTCSRTSLCGDLHGAGAWDENDRLRTEASAVIARAAQAAGVPRLIQESLAFVYADGGDDWLDEDAPVHATGTTETALVAETNAMQLFRGEAVVLRVRPVHRARQSPHANRHPGRTHGHLAQPRTALGVPGDRLAR